MAASGSEDPAQVAGVAGVETGGRDDLFRGMLREAERLVGDGIASWNAMVRSARTGETHTRATASEISSMDTAYFRAGHTPSSWAASSMASRTDPRRSNLSTRRLLRPWTSMRRVARA